MKLNFKDLKQQAFSVEAEPTDTIAVVKSKVAEEKGFDAAQMRLIYSGKILADDKTVEFYKIEQKGYIVCMVQKPKPAPAAAKPPPSTPAPAAAPATPATPAAPAPASAGTSTPSVPVTPSPAPSAAATTQSTRSFGDATPLMLGPERQAAIANMESMGFPRADCERALRAAFFNPDRAVEYLLTGIPDTADQQAPAATQIPTSPPAAPLGTATTGAGEEPVNLFEAAAAAGRGGNTGARGAAGAGADPGAEALAAAGGNLDFLRENPMFQQLRQLVQQQPQMLESVLQQVAGSNPQLAQLIASNPEQFLQLLAEGEEGDVPMPPGAQNISVTPEERDAIERLCRLGFERDLVIQAYFACDKNEELAANFLFENPDDMEE